MPRLTMLSIGTVAALVIGQSAARAENPLIDDQPPVLHVRPLLDGRHILAPQFGMTLDDPYQQNLMAGIYYRYHLTSWFGIGLDVWAGGGVDTSLTDDIDRELSRPGRPFQLSTSSLQLLGDVAVELVPFSGKALLFSDALIRVDVHFTLGFGIAMIAGDGRIDDSISIAPNFGAGLRLFPTSWLSIGLELRDYLVNRALASRRDGSVPGASFDHNWLFGLSIGFSFPTTPEIEGP
ncbi:MAG: outer membrane beta-barrel domain-containing protein [Myxococcota bacterium]